MATAAHKKSFPVMTAAVTAHMIPIALTTRGDDAETISPSSTPTIFRSLESAGLGPASWETIGSNKGAEEEAVPSTTADSAEDCFSNGGK